MPSPSRLLPVLASLAMLLGLVGLTPGTANAAPADPLDVVITGMTPGEIPENGPVRITGTVTNPTDQAWTEVNVQPFFSYTPMTTQDQLDEAMETDPRAEVGNRIDSTGAFDTIPRLAPGESQQFTIRLSQDVIDTAIAGTEGIYWIGVHVLGDSGEGRDGEAKARARTFIPLIRRDSAVTAGLVVPVRRASLREANGRLSDEAGWAADLNPGGGLANLIGLANAASNAGSGVPLTWVVDPAVLDAVGTLAAGNNSRNLGPRSSDVPPSESPEPSESPSSPGGSEGSSPAPSPSATPAAGIATADLPNTANAWLEGLSGALNGSTVLSLPYGDPDLVAATRHGPQIPRIARKQSRLTMHRSGISSRPAVAPESGYLDRATIRSLNRETATLVDGRIFGVDSPATQTLVGGHELVTVDTDADEGGPRPEPTLGALAVRQRLLAEAAVHALGSDDPFLLQLPTKGVQGFVGPEFFTGMQTDWLDLNGYDAVTIGSPTAQAEPGALQYPRAERRRELGARSFEAAGRLSRRGAVLDTILPLTRQVRPQTLRQALEGVSVHARGRRGDALNRTRQARSWVNSKLSKVTVSGPPSLTLSSQSGRFGVTVTNGLSEPVEVRIRAATDTNLTIEAPGQIPVEGGGQSQVLMRMRSDRVGVHPLQLILTDTEDRRLGATDTLQVRAAQISQWIWVAMGVGAAILFGAIAIRLGRRIAAARRAARTAKKGEAA